MAAGPGPASPRRPRDGAIRVDGVDLHYVEWGPPQPSPLLFLHGGSAHARWWDFVIAGLGDEHCIALDLRGHGDSGWPDDGDYRLETHADDVAGVIAALGLDRVRLIGHSFGGFVAMRYAARGDARLAALVIVDTRSRIGAHSARLLEALRKLPHPRYASLEQAIARFRLLPAASTATPEVLAHVARHAMRRHADGT